MIRIKIFETAMNYLSEGSCSEKQLRIRLEKKFAQIADLESYLKDTLTRLHQLGLINDERIAYRLAERFSHKGDQFIASLLQQQGIGDELIKTTLGRIGDEYYRAFCEARNKIRDCHDESIEQAETTIMRFLSGRHFSFMTVKKVINKLLKEGMFERYSLLDQPCLHG